MFSNEFRERLRRGKYSRWAVDLTEANLEAIIWMIGEYGQRGEYFLPLLAELWKREGSGRAAVALEQLFRVVMGDRPDLATSSRQFLALLDEARGLAQDKGRPPAHNWPVEWQDRVVGCVVNPTIGLGGLSCSGVWWATDGASDFLQSLGQLSPHVRVVVGGISAWVKSAPDELGRIEFGLITPDNYSRRTLSRLQATLLGTALTVRIANARHILGT